jgi:hypothetical protein
VLWRDAPAPFDAIDFNENFSDIDPLYDLAFLLMDLEHRGHADLCPPVLNAWAEAMASAPGADVETAYGGLQLLPLYKAVRAAIRAKTGALAVQASAPAPVSEDAGSAGLGAAPAAPRDPRLAAARAYLGLALDRGGRAVRNRQVHRRPRDRRPDGRGDPALGRHPEGAARHA